MRIKTFTRAAGLLTAAACALSCSTKSDDAVGSFAPGTPLYVVFSRVETDEEEAGYLGVTDSLDGDIALDRRRALEVPGSSRFYAPKTGGFFAIGSNEDLTITRYDVSEAGALQRSGKVSFAGLGVTRLHFRTVFVSETKAYYVDHTQAQLIVWNPRDMTIERSIALPKQLADGYQGYTTVLPYHRYPLVEGQLFIPVSWFNYDDGSARPVTGLVVFDTAKDELVSYTETERCAAATELAFDDNGDVYYGTNVNYPFFSYAFDREQRAAQRPACILRVRAGEQGFDQDYLVTLSDAVGGRAAMGLTDGATPGLGYVQVLNEEKLAWSDIADEDAFWESAEWQWWRVDLRSGKAVRDAELPASSPYMTSYEVDGRRFISRQTSDGESRLFELSADGEHKPAFRSIGEIRGVARVR